MLSITRQFFFNLFNSLCFWQLSDRNFYCLQEENLTTAHNHLIKNQIDEMVAHKEISQKTADYLFLENPRTAKFYLLPKIHKN